MLKMADVFLILATVSSAAMAVALKFFDRKEGNRYGILLGNYMTCVVVAFLMLPEKKILFSPDPLTLLCGCISGCLFVGGLVSMQSSIARNGAALTTAFARLGLIVPLLISILAFGERPEMVQCIGLLFVFAALLVISTASSGGSANHTDKMQPGLLLLVLLICGSSDAMAKVFEVVGSRAEDELFYFCIFAAAFLLTSLLACRQYRTAGEPVPIRVLLAGIAVGIPNYFSSALLLKALVGRPAIIVYPVFSIGAILIVSVISTLAFKEKQSRQGQIGLALIIGALLLLNI